MEAKEIRRITRAKIYRGIAERIAFDMKDSWAICLELDGELKERGIDDWVSCIDYFPEFRILKPLRNVNGNMWWTNGRAGNNARILALLLSEQMALHPYPQITPTNK